MKVALQFFAILSLIVGAFVASNTLSLAPFGGGVVLCLLFLAAAQVIGRLDNIETFTRRTAEALERAYPRPVEAERPRVRPAPIGRLRVASESPTMQKHAETIAKLTADPDIAAHLARKKERDAPGL